ncbi:MAG: hypothetical protein V3575_01335 [Candidatus Absconditabacteria bacterium]
MNNLILTRNSNTNNIVTNPDELLKIGDEISKSIFDILSSFNNEKKIKILQFLGKIRFHKCLFLIEDHFSQEDLNILRDPFSYFKKDRNENIDMLISYFKNNNDFVNIEFIKCAFKAIIYYHKGDYYKCIINASDAHKYEVCPHYDLELSLYDDNATAIKSKVEKQLASDLLSTLHNYSIYFQYNK